jgi:RNA polymerase sigma-70 factor (ECF subfamily)
MQAPDAFDLSAVFRRDPQASRALVHALMPGIQARIHAVLSRSGRATPSRESVAEYAQEVFLALFENDCRVLRSWDPERGASLKTFVNLVAERVVLGILRSGRRSAWLEDPTEDATIEVLAGDTQSLEVPIGDRDHLRKLLDALKIALPPRGVALFIALYAEERDIEDVARQFEMTPNAVYIWRNRLKALLVDLNEKLMRERVPPAAAPTQGVP